jgi:hypothetical protein
VRLPLKALLWQSVERSALQHPCVLCGGASVDGGYTLDRSSGVWVSERRVDLGPPADAPMGGFGDADSPLGSLHVHRAHDDARGGERFSSWWEPGGSAYGRDGSIDDPCHGGRFMITYAPKIHGLLTRRWDAVRIQ